VAADRAGQHAGEKDPEGEPEQEVGDHLIRVLHLTASQTRPLNMRNVSAAVHRVRVTANAASLAALVVIW
jgi:hypothetical protein